MEKKEGIENEEKKENIELEVSGDINEPQTPAPDISKSLQNKLEDKFLNVFAKLIPLIFLAIAIGVGALWGIGFVTEYDDYIIYGIYVINILISIFGACVVYRFGIIQDSIDKLKRENKQYKTLIDALKNTTVKLKTTVNELNSSVKSLENDADKINEQTKEFEPLIEELTKIAGDNKQINDIINKTNSIVNNMKTTVLENERANLISTYYECAFRDENNKMNKREYKKFLIRLTREQRDKFNQFGTFEELAGEDGLIDLKEMQNIIDKVLQQLDVLLNEQLQN